MDEEDPLVYDIDVTAHDAVGGETVTVGGGSWMDGWVQARIPDDQIEQIAKRSAELMLTYLATHPLMVRLEEENGGDSDR